ncbi:MAG: c-type cytochrome, partial [Candidatus Rokuibacteriota bacterium]
LLLAACGQEQKPPPAAGGDPALGQQIYLGQCTACHAADPAADGALGPAVKGASKQLLEARLLHGTYPPGYTPKRETRVMQPMPSLSDNIDDLAAYLR